MKSFLLKEKKPIIKWGMLPDDVYFEGEVPKNYQLGVCPSDKFIILDVDRHGDKDGFDNIPKLIQKELNNTLNYITKNNGKHYWMFYTGNKPLGNKTSGKGFDLRTEKGYVVWYPKYDIRDVPRCKIKNTSEKINKFLEKHFSFIEE